MEPSRSTSRSRRSYPNLHNLSIAPLSAKYPLDASVPPSPDEPSTQTPRTSYIAQKSAPTTPGVLSLSQSRSSSRQRTRKAYAYDGYFIESNSEIRVAGDIPKAKSTSVLQPGVSFTDEAVGVAAGNKQRHHTRKGTAPLPLRSPPIKYHTKESNHEWFHRAGLAIAGETRDSKGQGWLVRRESSTSLVGQGDQDGTHHHDQDNGRMALLSGEHVNEADYPSAFFSPRISRAGSRFPSRIGSRVPSARPSRRGSRVGSRVDMLTSLSGPKSASARHSLDMMSEPDDRFIEPDFIEADDDDSDGDEEEVARLARERGFGLGGWMDKLIGWTLFSVDEDREASSDSESESEDEYDNDNAGALGSRHRRGNDLKLDDLTKEELKLRREVEARRRKLEREAIVAASAVKSSSLHGEASRPSTAEGGNDDDDDAEHTQRGSNEEAGGWQDAAWLLSVASKALF